MVPESPVTTRELEDLLRVANGLCLGFVFMDITKPEASLVLDEHLDLTERELFVLSYLKLQCKKHGVCRESRKELSRNLKIRIQSITETMRSLEKKNLIFALPNPNHKQKRFWKVNLRTGAEQ